MERNAVFQVGVKSLQVYAPTPDAGDFCHGKVEGLPYYEDEALWQWEKYEQVWRMVDNESSPTTIPLLTCQDLHDMMAHSCDEFLPKMITEARTEGRTHHVNAIRRTQHLHMEIRAQLDSLLRSMLQMGLLRRVRDGQEAVSQ